MQVTQSLSFLYLEMLIWKQSSIYQWHLRRKFFKADDNLAIRMHSLSSRNTVFWSLREPRRALPPCESHFFQEIFPGVHIALYNYLPSSAFKVQTFRVQTNLCCLEPSTLETFSEFTDFAWASVLAVQPLSGRLTAVFPTAGLPL